MGNRRICIVTPDVVGPVLNGGIGTHAHNLALRLSEAGYEVDLLFTGLFERGTNKHWKHYYAAFGVNFISLDHLGLPKHPLRLDPVLQKSWYAYQFLKERDYGAIHFQDWFANGFFSIQAKRTLGFFSNTQLTLMLHSSTEWIAQGALRPFSRPIEDQLVAWCERYCARFADYVISPSKYMIDWAHNNGWQLAERIRILPYCLLGEPDASVERQVSRDAETTIAFFGRLETRKGLEPFVEGLNALPAKDQSRLSKVLFVGKNGVADNQSAARYIKGKFGKSAIDYELYLDLDVDGAHRLLKEKSAVAFAPSLVDNLPLTVLECCAKGIPILGANTGGIPEILPSSALFDPSKNGVAAAVRSLLDGKVVFGQPLYQSEQARHDWVEFSQELADTKPQQPDSLTKGIASQPRVSVCVPHYNYGRYIKQMLDGLTTQTYQNFEVVVIDDGSTDSASLEVFNTLADVYPSPQFRFFRKENQGVGATRNAAADKASGDYLVFMDADNVAKPDMIESFVDALQRTSADVVTCHFDVFNSEEPPAANQRPDFSYIPVGQCLEVGWADNVLGDANMIVRRSAFEKIDGFTTDRDSSWEDHELLLRLAFAGFEQEVVPKPLFWYRNQGEGFSRNTNFYKNQQRILRAYLEVADPNIRSAVRTMAMGSLYGGGLLAAIKQRLRYLARRHPRLASHAKRVLLSRKLNNARRLIGLR